MKVFLSVWKKFGMTEFHLLRFLKVCGLKQSRFWLNTREKGERWPWAIFYYWLIKDLTGTGCREITNLTVFTVKKTVKLQYDPIFLIGRRWMRSRSESVEPLVRHWSTGGTLALRERSLPCKICTWDIFDDDFLYNFGPLALSRSGVLKEIDVWIFDIWIFHSSETRSPLTVVFHSWIYWQGLMGMGNVQIILAVWFFHAALLSSRGVEAACLRKFGSEH